ncbi:FAD/NAD(P)-binding domain-containing protein [Zopfia rhizophila CBS 207.26]|uniref:FAD/NAD(P)-binding domain-containing protein n=1 Tax=Zopfia rhizophila CBS 207.26 TaxID=1314779 RepID=A0A6A6E9S9_9PEZI|nr:FAD/NAD(P)-binding domain-containing protein [Zopfia rhizophila CBS 207.26]
MHFPKITDSLAPLSPLTNLSLSSPHRILIIGAAYGGVSALLNLLDLSDGNGRQSAYPVPELKGLKSKNGIEITVIDERDGFFHSVGAPLAHVTKTYTPTMWKRYNRLNELRHSNLHFRHGSVQKVDPESKIAEYLDRSGKVQTQAYDYLIMATGLKRHWPAVPKSGSYEEYMNDAKELIEKITGKDEVQQGRRVVVIGAGEIKANYPPLHVTLIHSRNEVLSSEPLPSEVKERAKILLSEEGVDLILGNRASVEERPDGKFDVTLANGTHLTADVVLDATKKGHPTNGCLPPQVLNEEGEILVTPHLNFQDKVPNPEFHFGAGDVIAWSGIRRAGGAMVMGQMAAFNVFASILNSEKNADDEKFKLGELPEYPVVIGLAVGKQCLTYGGQEGIKWGVQLMKDYFQDDLGWNYSLKYLGLTDIEERAEEQPAKGKVELEIKYVKEVVPDPVPAEPVPAAA